MAIVEIECPNCGGKVKRKEEEFFVTCPFCGSEVCFNEIKEEVDLGKIREEISDLRKSTLETEEERIKLRKWSKKRRLFLIAIAVFNLTGFMVGAYASIRHDKNIMGFAMLFMITAFILFICSIPLVGCTYPGYSLLYGEREKGGKVKMALKITGLGIVIQFVTAFLAVIVMSLILSGCSLPFSGGSGGGLRYSGEKGGDPVTMSAIEGFSFSYSSGSYMNSGSSYNATRTDEGVEVVVRQDGYDIDDVPVIITDDSILDQIAEILDKNHVDQWNGYSLTAKDVMDGDSFSLYVTMDNGEILRASGYEAWPEGYANVRGELDALFVDLYESYYPNKQKALKAYFDQEIAGSAPFCEEVTLEYPYIRTGESEFEYGDPKLSECVITRLIDDFSGDNDYPNNDPREMLIVRLYPEDAEKEGFVRTVMSVEVYRIDDDLEITKAGETVIDEDVSSNEGIYGRLFIHEYAGESYLCYNVIYNNKASVDDNAYLLRLFSMKDGAFEKVADEKVCIPDDRESVTIDDLSGFADIAEKYGFMGSLRNWKEKPWDPMVDRFEGGRIIVDMYTKNNFDKGFDDAFLSAPIGEKVGDYGISGTITGVTWYD